MSNSYSLFYGNHQLMVASLQLFFSESYWTVKLRKFKTVEFYQSIENVSVFDLNGSIDLLGPNVGDVIILIGTYVPTNFSDFIPSIDFLTLQSSLDWNNDNGAKEMAKKIVQMWKNPPPSEGPEVYQAHFVCQQQDFLPFWDEAKMNVLMLQVHSMMPLRGYWYCKSIRTIYIQPANKDRGCCSISDATNQFQDFKLELKSANNHYDFDMETGFISNNYCGVPIEMRTAFELWVKNGKAPVTPLIFR